jgi:hypothetical protein
MMISLLFHRYPSVPCQGCTVTNFRCLPAERDTIQHTQKHKHAHQRVRMLYTVHHTFVALAWLGMMQSKSIVQLTTHVDTNPSYDYDPYKQVNASQCNVSHHYQEHITLSLTFIHILVCTDGTSPTLPPQHTNTISHTHTHTIYP